MAVNARPTAVREPFTPAIAQTATGDRWIRAGELGARAFSKLSDITLVGSCRMSFVRQKPAEPGAELNGRDPLRRRDRPLGLHDFPWANARKPAAILQLASAIIGASVNRRRTCPIRSRRYLELCALRVYGTRAQRRLAHSVFIAERYGDDHHDRGRMPTEG
jgi:hypothetical protein